MEPLDIPPQSDREPSCIDRFVWAHYNKFVGYTGSPMVLAGGIITGVLGLQTVIFSILAATSNASPIVPVVLASIAAAAGGATLAKRSSMKDTISPEVRMSTAGKKLIYRIANHIGWHSPEAYGSSPYRNFWWQSLFGRKTARNLLSTTSADLFERAAYDYNRIAGMLKLTKESGGKANHLAPQIQAASNEAMISLINQIALLESNPETKGPIEVQCREQIRKLTELAALFESRLEEPTSIMDRLSSTNLMDNVLDQLRYEKEAQQELHIMDRED
ncbi:MAG TPA: hypothetical protein VK171_05980 [Fimbriimonas sp.]|nr:hypothetical protein [Fimbriimonas sp.]